MNRPDDELFSDALELPPGQRSAFLDRACAGDAAQRARLDALLRGQAAAAGFLEASPVPRPSPLPEEQPGDTLDRYVLQRRIGEGGCGVVYLAEQTTPVRRLVALKVIKLGMDTREVIARFEAERQALAMMDHPGIARVFDAGATATGRPYFVMEFVDGLPITRFCDEHRLTTKARLDLFARVCLAIQHAHQKGIIHRDVKPSNVLVAMHDGVPTPKIIDFGIAKATQGRLAEHTLVTSLDQLIGTPAYMSPEQVEARELDIDTRSDVYALGVLLYELLTGRPPYDPKSLVQAGVAEIRRIIREVDPPRPSTRLATLTDADRDTVARLRGAAPTQLTSVLRGDLDWIAMRCLEKDRARRYGTAQELADDVRRHLRREAVVARPPDAVYRTRKFISRHRFAVGAASAVALALIAGTIVSLIQANRARRAEIVARFERDVARTAQHAEALARADAQRRQEQAEQLLTFMLGDFRTELKGIGKLSLLDSVGDKALAHFAALDVRDLTDAALTQQAKALTQIGEIRLDQARYADAASAFETALQRAAALTTRHPQNADMLFERAQAEFWLGLTARRRGDFDSMHDWLTRYRSSTQQLIRLEGDTARALKEASSGEHNLAVLEFDRGNLSQAERGFLAERMNLSTLRQKNPRDFDLQLYYLDANNWLGKVAQSDGRFAQALEYFEIGTGLLRERVLEQPDVPHWKARLADNLGFKAHLHAIIGAPAEAHREFATAGELLEEVIAHDPQNTRWQGAALSFMLNRAQLLFAIGDAVAASDLLGVARIQIEDLATKEPSSKIIQRRLATALRLEARFKFPGEPDQALPIAQRAAELSCRLFSTDSRDPRNAWEYTQASLLVARLHLRGEKPAEARKVLREIIPLLERQRSILPRDWHILDPLAQAYALLGEDSSAAQVRELLKQIGYRSVDPLAASTLEAFP